MAEPTARIVADVDGVTVIPQHSTRAELRRHGWAAFIRTPTFSTTDLLTTAEADRLKRQARRYTRTPAAARLARRASRPHHSIRYL